ncbi:non-homologous end-joining DNA ligase [Pedobacter sp. GR22-10]|uniref:non-homologous end-joining DNA ligase n=1 Tax=Pedobacter sp. GR22-10 TaxID=2994472 RepID=UPI002AFFFBA8|nr:non-homologous end-joining DNA ligase [Pedobacter sp. GR22-10]
MAKEKMPVNIAPMLCRLVSDIPTLDSYLAEIKWDGYRIISSVQKGKVIMNSRGGLDYTNRYPLIAEALVNLGHDAVLDGEVVVFSEGKPDFNAVQLYNGKRTPIAYCLFDLLYLNGHSLMALPLSQRKELLQQLVKGSDVLQFSASFDDAKALYQQMLDRDLEGIVMKKKDSEYIPGARGNEWLKIPTRKRQEFVIGGWAESDKARSFKSLLFGAYENGNLTWIGRSGGGFKEKEMPGILKKLQSLEIEESPFINKVLDTKGAKIHWARPELVANFEFAAWTETGRIRKPATFLGFRADKKATDVVREVPKEEKEIAAAAAAPKKKAKAKSKGGEAMKIATYNVNGINGRLPVLLRWLEEEQPDVVCLQELKAPQERFPLVAINSAGYQAIWKGQKSWNGVAILSREHEIKELRRELPGDPEDEQSRYLEAIVNNVVICCLYMPNGNPYPGPKFEYKLKWFKRLAAHANKLKKINVPVILVGDFNVMPTEKDVYKPERWVDDALFRKEVRAAFKKLTSQGWTDAIRKLYPEETIYTFWDYFRNAYGRNAGLRIDHFLLSPHLIDRLTDAGVDKGVRGWEKSSDHAPVWIKIE